MLKRTLLMVGLLTVVAALPCNSARAQVVPQICGSPQPGTPPIPCLYSVKFICGLQTQPVPPFIAPSEPPVKPGNYATAVNIQNFHTTLRVTIAKRASIANTENQQPGLISGFQKLVLSPGQALEIDCPDIVGLLSSAGTKLPPFIKGFVEVFASQQLSVTGVYTAQQCLPNPIGAVGCTPTGPVSLEVVPNQAFVGP